MSLEIFVDAATGSVQRGTQPAWGFAVYEDAVLKYEAADLLPPCSSTNAAELMAFIQVLAFCSWQDLSTRVVTIWTDSKYVAEGMASLRTQNRKGKSKNEVLWKAVHNFFFGMGLYSRVVVRWVKGHNGTEGNERAHWLVTFASRKSINANRTKNENNRTYSGLAHSRLPVRKKVQGRGYQKGCNPSC